MIIPVADQLRLSDFDYHLPENLIAQEPSPLRDQSRLMLLHRGTREIAHLVFSGLEDRLIPGDVLVLNNTKVFPCRLFAKKPGGGKAELFLLTEKDRNLWQALIKGCSSSVRTMSLSDGIQAEILEHSAGGVTTVRFSGTDDIKNELPRIGKTPLPPYIKREPSDADRERYQTVYAAHVGAVAAPTAGLHFTAGLLERLESKGVLIVFVTLHVGPGTFQPVRSEFITEHLMLTERYEITRRAAETVNAAKAEGRRIIAVGTTSVRALESATSQDGTIEVGEGSSSLFIYPGYAFKIIDGLITNFHLPKSTLLMLVSAFVGREHILSAYRTAVENQYRFYSYGDAMMIV